MQLIKNSLKMLDDIKLLDHNIQNLTTTTATRTEMPMLCRLEHERKHMEEMTYAYLTASFPQITCKNVPASSSTMPAVTPLTINTKILRETTNNKTTTITTKQTDFANGTKNVNNVATTLYISKIINIGSNIKIKYKINNNNNNNTNNNVNSNNNNNNNILNIKYNIKNNSKSSSCCQCTCEHETHYEQNALLKRIKQQKVQQQEENLQKYYQLKEVKVQRHDKQPKTATVLSPTSSSEECVRRVLRNCANTCDNKNYYYSYNSNSRGSSKKHGKLFQTHFSISLLKVKEEEEEEVDDKNEVEDNKDEEIAEYKKCRHFSTYCLSLEETTTTKTTIVKTTVRKTTLKSSTLDLRKCATVGYFESLSAASLLTPPPLLLSTTTTTTITTTPTATSTIILIIIKRKHISTIKTPRNLTILKTEHELMQQQQILENKGKAVEEEEEEEKCCMTKFNMSAKAKSILLKDVMEEDVKLLLVVMVVVMMAKLKESLKNVANQIELKENLVFRVDHDNHDYINNNDDCDDDVVVIISLKLKRNNTPQLVMPIEGNCSRLLMTVSNQHKHKLKALVQQSLLLWQPVKEVWQKQKGDEFKMALKKLTKQQMHVNTTLTTKLNLITKTTKTTLKLNNNKNNKLNNCIVVASDSCFKETTSDIVNLRLQHAHHHQHQHHYHQEQEQQQQQLKLENLQSSSKVHDKDDEVTCMKDSSIFSNLLATMAFLTVTAAATSRLNGTLGKSISSTWCNTIYMNLLLLLLMMTTTAYCWTGRQDAMTNCTFPVRWEGSWFLSGYQQSIHIKGSQFSYRGKCLASDGNKYLIVDEKGCHRCLVIYEKHKNVLQYKESECEGDSMYMHQANPPSALAMRSVLLKDSQNAGGEHRGGAHPNIPNSELNTNTNIHPNVANGHSRLSSSDQFILRSNDDMNDYFCKGRETLQNLCDQIPGDALLYSLFRESAEPVKCPLRGPFVFTYNRGHGECKSPLSNIESCTEESRLLLSFQACPDVQGTESTVEELTCLATWKDGNSRYLVGLVSHHHAISNEERYRCFVYEKLSTLLGAPAIVSVSKDAEYKLAQSGDATCNGLDSAEVGSRIMSLRKPPLAERCDFPSWFKGPRHWHALMGNAVYNYHVNDGSVHVIKPNGYMETRALCEQINKQTSTEMMAVVHYTTGCQSGFMCMMFYRRDTHVIEIQTGKPAARLEDACAPDHFDITRMSFITLLASNPDPQICPMEGLYNLRGPIGPPYLATRHKRNHNNKSHGNHGHHHQQQQQQQQIHLQQGEEMDAIGHENMAYIGHKRHINSNLNYRNGAEQEQSVDLTTRIRRAVDNERHEIRLMPGNLAQSTHANGSSSNPDDDTSLGPRSRRNAPPCITNYKAQRRLWVGCTDQNVIDVRPMCTDEGDEEYSCHGHWTENGTVYIIARHKGSKHGVCISYRPTEGNSAKLVIGDACYRGVETPPEHHLVANLSVFGKCGETGNGGVANIRPDSTCCYILLGMAVFISFMGHWWHSMQHR